MRSQQRGNGEILSDLRHPTSSCASNNAPSLQRASAATIPVLRVSSWLLGTPSSGQDRQHKNRSTTPDHRPGNQLDSIHRRDRWTRSAHRCPAGYSWTRGFWTRACPKRNTGTHSLLRRHRRYNCWIRRPVFRGVFLSSWSWHSCSAVIRMAWCYHHYRWRSHRHLRGPADLCASAEQRPDTIMDRLFSFNRNQYRKLPVHPSFLQRNRIRVSRHFSHLFPRNHTSSAIRSVVLLGKTAHRQARNPLTNHTAAHGSVRWHTSNH